MTDTNEMETSKPYDLLRNAADSPEDWASADVARLALAEIERLHEIINRQKRRPSERELLRRLRNERHAAKGWQRSYGKLRDSIDAKDSA